MNILVQLSHPSQFYCYRRSIEEWKADGHRVLVAIKTKDILEPLLKSSGIEYVNINRISHRGSRFGALRDMIHRDIRLVNLCIREKIDILTGCSAEVAQVGWLLRRHSVCIGDDDADIVPFLVMCSLPFLQTRLSPDSCRCGRMEPRTVHYNGFQKMAYLHPNVFSPDSRIPEKYGIYSDRPFFLLRLVSLTAHHDSGIKGIDDVLLSGLTELLGRYGKVLISSERKLGPDFEKYRLAIDPLDIHHIMAFSSLYIGDSQSMAVEAAVLGVPNIRYNDFTGKRNIGVLEELEESYGLTVGIPTGNPDRLLGKVSDMLSDVNRLRSEWQDRRRRMLSEKIDVSAFLTWFIENYPSSRDVMREKPDYQYRFR